MIYNDFSIHPSLPYNWRSPIGYLISVILQVTSTYICSVLFVAVLLLYIGFCSFSIAFATDIRRSLSEFNDDIMFHENRWEGMVPPARQLIELKKKFYKITQFHADSIQLSVFSELFH